MGRGVSAGGGQSSLGYLFGSGEAPAPSPQPPPPTDPPTSEPSSMASVTPPQVDNSKPTPPSTGYTTNNYQRTDGPNCGNFITDRPTTKVHSAPGGSSSLNYLFGDGSK